MMEESQSKMVSDLWSKVDVNAKDYESRMKGLLQNCQYSNTIKNIMHSNLKKSYLNA